MLSGAKHLAYEAAITLETKSSSSDLSEVPHFVRDDVTKTRKIK